jgi:hypothetical protein
MLRAKQKAKEQKCPIPARSHSKAAKAGNAIVAESLLDIAIR